MSGELFSVFMLCRGKVTISYNAIGLFFVSEVIARISKKSFVWFNTAQDEDRPLLRTLSLAWPPCGLKSSLQWLKNSWGRLVASVQEWVHCPGHFDHRFSESKSLFHWSWHYQVVQTCTNASHCQHLLIPDYTYLDNNIPPAYKLTSDPWLQCADIK